MDKKLRPTNHKQQLNVALVHDDFIQWGGAERVLAALAEIFPSAPVYTSMADSDVVLKSGIDPKRFRTSWMDGLPFKSRLNKAIFPLYPVVFESFDFTNFDVVITTSTRFAHGSVTREDVKHVAYIHSPFRGFWEPDLYFGNTKKGRFVRALLAPMLSYFRGWDYVAAQRADLMFANSLTSQARVRKYYRRDTKVLYPFVDFERFDNEEKPDYKLPNGEDIDDGEYYVAISRLVDWKRFDIAVEAFNQMKKNLIVIGTGPYIDELSRMAGSTVRIAGFVPDSEVSYLLRRAKANIHPQKEDFGMTVVEGNYCGIPSIAFDQGGSRDTIIEDQTGVFFSEQSAESIIDAVTRREQIEFDKDLLKEHAVRFGKERFSNEWKEVVESVRGM